MKPQGPHGMLPEQTPEEQARHNFQVSMKQYVYRTIGPAVHRVYEEQAKPAFEKREGRAPADRHDVASVMDDKEIYEMWCALLRSQQEQYIDSTNACVERQLPDLIGKFRAFSTGPTHGSLTLDPGLEIPRYQSEVDIHCVPGSYFAELTEDDVFPGARYDIGIYMYGVGAFGPYNDDQGHSAIKFIQDTYPDLQPKRILDMGCTNGNNIVPYADAFPEAEIHAIDVAAPCLRYGHARAESLGKAIHFSQQNAERTTFKDESFDLIVSHILMHETSRRALYAIQKECFRLLRSGGLALHVDVPIRNDKLPPFQQFMADYDTKRNNEPFWATYHDIDLIKPSIEAGFSEADSFESFTPSITGQLLPGFNWLMWGARKS